MDLNGRSALVTGGAAGLGAATVRRPVGLGVGVAIFDRAEHGQRGVVVNTASIAGTEG
jgi:NAD(P)-dependent dehydrogenase (short-subunit alcohol dehydrogenase family)